jgi:hypothetical protein
MERFGRACHEHKLDVIVKVCPIGCNKHHTHEDMDCPAGHPCYLWDAYDSTLCWRHARTPELHIGCQYAMSRHEEILHLAEWLDPATILLHITHSQRKRTFGVRNAVISELSA